MDSFSKSFHKSYLHRQSFLPYAGQRILVEYFTLAAFVPTDPPAFDLFSFVNPNLFHNIYSIVIMGVRIKGKKRIDWSKIVRKWRHETKHQKHFWYNALFYKQLYEATFSCHPDSISRLRANPSKGQPAHLAFGLQNSLPTLTSSA